MESDNENNGLEIDSSPGALVWVRRRNGSWWPGRVLGPEELPENCLNFQRSGTPIKLLGREDGSVDWYNLDKSKRVKQFRCGEYDECIEKAKEHGLHSNRKPVNSGKYVRREDAILHALELEGPSGENQNFCSGNDSSTVKANKTFGLQLNTIGHNTEEPVYAAKKSGMHKKSSQKLPQSGISFEHLAKQTASNMQVIQNKRWRAPNDSEDDTTKGMKRMRDLQDLGSGMILKKEPNGSVETKGFHDLALPDSASLSESDFDNDLSCDTPINSSKDSCSSLKRKRLHMGQAYESLKKKCRRRSLAEVWMGATKVKIQSLGHPGAITKESSLQGLTNIKARDDNFTSKKNDSPPRIDDSADCSGTSCEEALLNTHENAGNTVTGGALFQSGMKDSLFSDILEFIEDDLSDRFIDVPVMAGDNAAGLPPTYETFPATKANSVGEENLSNHCIQVGLVSQLNEGLCEACSSGSSTQVNDVPLKIDMGASEWHTKGKRNARQSSNRTVDLESLVDRTDQLDTCLVNRTAQKGTANSTSDESLTSDSSGQRIKCMSVSEVRDAAGDQKPKFSLVNAGRQNFEGENSHVNPAVNANAGCSIPCALGSGALNTGDGLDSPMPTQVSLQPRQIRLPSRYRVSEESSTRLYDVEVRVQSNYQGQRVPLVSLMSKFNGKAIVGHPVTVEMLASGCTLTSTSSSIKKFSKDKASTITISHAKGDRGAPLDKTSNVPMSRSPWSNRKPSSAKKPGFSPRKIRRLSSFVVDHKNKEDRRKLVVEKIGGPAVSCIPLRLVFSRLNEALSSSARPAN